MEKQFIDILENGKSGEIIPFLQSLNEKERKKLSPLIKEAMEYLKNNRPGMGFAGSLSSLEIKLYYRKRDILAIAIFVCYSTSQLNHIPLWDFPKNEEINEILEWYCPPGFSSIINRLGTYEHRSIPYEYILDWQDRGLYEPSREVIVRYLPQAAQKTVPEVRALFHKYPITLQEHIWYLLESPSTINQCDRIGEYQRKKSQELYPDGYWTGLINELVVTGEMERKRVLRSVLTAINPVFNKQQTTWFSNLFITLGPTREELIVLQDELFNTLSYIYSKPINTTLSFFKDLCLDKQFDISRFSDILPNLLSSETRSVVTAALRIVEMLLKKRSDESQELISAIPYVLLNKDEGLQKKCVALLNTYAEETEELKEIIHTFSDSLLAAIRPSLAKWLAVAEQTTDAETAGEATLQSTIRQETQLTEVQTKEDFIFFINQAIGLNDPVYFDLLLNELIRWTPQLTGKEAELLEPLIKKAYAKLTSTNAGGKMGQITCNLLINYGEALQTLKGIIPSFQKIRKQAFDKRVPYSQNRNYHQRLVGLDQLDINWQLFPFRDLALYALAKIENGDSTPLLSTPTHAPAWIAPDILAERIRVYIDDSLPFNDIDMQLALQRCNLEETEKAFRKIQQFSNGEIKDLLTFFFIKDSDPHGKIIHPCWWITAGATRSPQTHFPEFKNIGYDNLPADVLSGNHLWEIIKVPRKYGEGDSIRLSIPTEKHHLTQPQPLLLEYPLTGIDSQTMPFHFMANPNNTGSVCMKAACWSYIGYEAEDQAIASKAIRLLHTLNPPLGEMQYLLLTTTLLIADATIRDYSWQFWVERVTAGTIDNQHLGKTIGKIQAFDVNPFKRLTDPIMKQIIGFSNKHNSELVILIESILSMLPVVPVNNLKKLLEIYRELILTGAKSNPANIPSLNEWEKIGNLRKIIKEIRNHSNAN